MRSKAEEHSCELGKSRGRTAGSDQPKLVEKRDQKGPDRECQKCQGC